jgi:hypothetical protein
MNIENTPSAAKENSFKEYALQGGILNKKDYADALLRAKNIKNINQSTMAQAENMARVAGISLTDEELSLYAVLREDIPEGKDKDHYTQKNDQRLFAEVLRMLGDAESLQKLISRHPNIFPQGEAAAI